MRAAPIHRGTRMRSIASTADQARKTEQPNATGAKQRLHVLQQEHDAPAAITISDSVRALSRRVGTSPDSGREVDHRFR